MKVMCYAALLCVLSATSARAEAPPDALPKLQAAVAKFEALAKKTKAEGRLPHLSRPDEAPIIEAVWDEPALLGKPPYAQKDMQTLFAISKAELSVMFEYLLYGGSPPNAAHVAKYLDEILRAEAFTFQVSADTLPGATEFWASLKPEQRTDVRKAGLKQMRLGIKQFVSGFTEELQARISDKNKKVITQVLAKNAAVMADSSPPEDCQIYVAQAQKALPMVPDALKPDIATFIKAMSTTACTGLCLAQ